MPYINHRSFDSEVEARSFNKIAARLLPFLVLLYVISFLDRVNVGFAKLQMAADVGLSDAAYGFGAGIFFLGYCAFEIPSNLLLQRFGAKFWIARILVVWGAISMAMAYVSTPTMFYVFRFLLGVAEAGFYPGILLYLTYWFPSRIRSQVTAMFFLGLPISVIIGAPVSGWIRSTFNGNYGLAGWQWLFIIEGAPAVILGFVTYLYLDNGPANAAWLSDEERQAVIANLEAERRVQQSAGAGHKFSHVMKDINAWLLSFTNFTMLAGLYGVTFWLPQIIKDLGVKDLLVNGIIAAVPFIAGSIIMVLVARHSDHRSERKWHTVGAAVVGAAGLMLTASFSSDALLALIGLALATGGLLGAFAVIWTLPSKFFVGPAAAAGIALMATIGNLGGYAAPSLLGVIKDATHRLDSGLYVLAALVLLGVVAVLVLPKLRRPEPAVYVGQTSRRY